MAPQYWEERNQIGEDILIKLNQTLIQTYARVTGFQMLLIDLPASYEESIVSTQVMVQMKETKKYEQQATTIRESINVDISEADMNITIINANATSKAITISNIARKTCIANTISYETKAYNDTQNLLGLTAKDHLLDYIYYQNVMNMEKTEFVIGLNNAFININTNRMLSSGN